MEIIDDIFMYHKTQIPPANIKTIVKYLNDYGNSNQIVFGYCTDIICDWSFENDTHVLLETNYLKFIDEIVFSNEFYIFNIKTVLTTLFNIFEDTHHVIDNVEKLITRIQYCDIKVIQEWFALLSIYSQYYFNAEILQYVCTSFKQRTFVNQCTSIILHQCKLDSKNALKILDTNDMFREIIHNYIQTCNFNNIRIIEFAIKNKTPLTFNLFFIELLYSTKYLYTFLTLLLTHQYSFYRNCEYIDFYTTQIFTRKTYSTFTSQLTFLKALLQTNDDYSLYGKSTFVYVNKILKYKLPDDVICSSLQLVRKIYNYDSAIISKRLLKKYVLHPQGGKYFCTSLKEKTYRMCLINDIKVDNCFKCFM
jgi:hypothetical protein